MNEKISVLMGVYNCEPTLEQAIRSIQAQTYPNWELIICDDGSADRSYEIAEQFAKEDDRIVLLKNDVNLGLNKTLNKCFSVSKGEYIARMDGDDISLDHRFEKELLFLKNHPEYAIVSSAMIFFDENGEWGKSSPKEFPTVQDVVTTSPLSHPAVMMRRECLESVGGYSEDLLTMRVEDVDLWIRLYEQGFRCCNIQEPLYLFRNDKNALNRRKFRYRINSTRVRLRGCRNLNLPLSCYVKAFKPMMIGLVPARLRLFLRKNNG